MGRKFIPGKRRVLVYKNGNLADTVHARSEAELIEEIIPRLVKRCTRRGRGTIKRMVAAEDDPTRTAEIHLEDGMPPPAERRRIGFQIIPNSTRTTTVLEPVCPKARPR